MNFPILRADFSFRVGEWEVSAEAFNHADIKWRDWLPHTNAFDRERNIAQWEHRTWVVSCGYFDLMVKRYGAARSRTPDNDPLTGL